MMAKVRPKNVTIRLIFLVYNTTSADFVSSLSVFLRVILGESAFIHKKRNVICAKSKDDTDVFVLDRV